jgi:hypothetical protein
MKKKRLLRFWIAVVVISFLFPLGSVGGQAQNNQPGSIIQSTVETIIPEAIGLLGGFTDAVSWQNNVAYVGNGLRLYILNVSDPSSPILMGETEILPNVVMEVIVRGSYAYVANGDSGLRILDVSDPTTPREIGLFEGTAQRLAIQDNFAYIDDGWGFRIIDISDPMHPTEVGYFQATTSGIEVSGNYAYISYYVNDLDGGLRIIDISDPAAPKETSYINTQSQIMSVSIVGNYAYATDYTYTAESGLSIIDISDPQQPVEISSYNTPGFARDVTVVGKYAYVADDDSGLRIIDIGNPETPFETGFYDTPGKASDVIVANTHAYVADFNEGLRIIDISNANLPNEAGFYKNTNLLMANEVAVSGNYAYIVDQNGGYYDGWDSSLRIIDISNPAAPSLIGSYDSAYGIFDLAVDGEYAYLAAGSEGLRIIDLSDATNPSEVGSYICTGRCPPDYTVAVEVVGNFAYVATGSDGILIIIDITEPSLPQLIGFYDTPGVGIDLSVQGKLVYFADYYNRLRIIDTSDPVWPKEVGNYETAGSPRGVTVAGNYAYTAEGYNGVRILDISNPTAPIEVGYYNPPAYAGSNVTIAGKYAYVNGYPGLRIIDISNPTSPTEVGEYNYGDGPDVAVEGNLAYLADGYAGLVDLRLLTDKVISTVPVSGGSLMSTDGRTNLIFPSGAFTQTVDVTYRQLLYDEYVSYWKGIDRTFDISAVYFDTRQSATLAPGQTFTVTMTYSDSETIPGFEDTLALFSWNDPYWKRDPSSMIDIEKNILIARPSHLSLWAILEDINRVFLTITRK